MMLAQIQAHYFIFRISPDAYHLVNDKADDPGYNGSVDNSRQYSLDLDDELSRITIEQTIRTAGVNRFLRQ